MALRFTFIKTDMLYIYNIGSSDHAEYIPRKPEELQIHILINSYYFFFNQASLAKKIPRI